MDGMYNYDKVREALEESNLTAVDFLNIVATWLGMEFLDDSFVEFLENEGIIEEETC